MKTRASILFGFLFYFLMNTAFAETVSFNVIKNPFRFSTYFELIGKNRYEGRVVKDSLHLRTTYDLYDHEGWYEAQGICRAMSLGAIFTWAKEIDIYDDYEEKIGFIDGKTCTTANARYDIYDAMNSYVGVAYLDLSRKGFSITDANGGMVACLKRCAPGETAAEDWEVVIYKLGLIDTRILKIFASFVVDYQDSF